MIYVVVSIRVKAGKLHEFLELFKSNAPIAKEDRGCIQYVPAVDIDTDLPPQKLDENVVTLIEQWESLEALHNHLVTPHMVAFFEKEKSLVENVSLKVLQEA